jgi:hypothetical protein
MSPSRVLVGSGHVIAGATLIGHGVTSRADDVSRLYPGYIRRCHQSPGTLSETLLVIYVTLWLAFAHRRGLCDCKEPIKLRKQMHKA